MLSVILSEAFRCSDSGPPSWQQSKEHVYFAFLRWSGARQLLPGGRAGLCLLRRWRWPHLKSMKSESRSTAHPKLDFFDYLKPNSSCDCWIISKWCKVIKTMTSHLAVTYEICKQEKWESISLPLSHLSPSTSSFWHISFCTGWCHWCVPHRLGIPIWDWKRNDFQAIPFSSRPRGGRHCGECWPRSHPVLTG